MLLHDDDEALMKYNSPTQKGQSNHRTGAAGLYRSAKLCVAPVQDHDERFNHTQDHSLYHLDMCSLLSS